MSDIAPDLERFRQAEFSLEELAAAAGILLRRLGLRPSDGRVAEVPDQRAIRFYQTAGVIDRPLRYDGRRAVYGFRHLVQLLAVKRLQEEKHPLSLIQRGLAGRRTEELEAALGGISESVAQASAEARPTPILAPGRPLVAVELAPGVTLTIDPAQVPNPEAVVTRVTQLLRQSKEDGQ